MKTSRKILFLPSSVVGAVAQSNTPPPRLTVQYENPIANNQYPELVYWFTARETLDPARYRADIQHIVHDTPFDFAFLTERRGVTFPDNKKADDAIRGLVENAHENGLGVGATLQVQRQPIERGVSLDDDQTLISDTEGPLDSHGAGSFQTTTMLRSRPPKKIEVLRVLAFRKLGDGEYHPATLTDVTSNVTDVASTKPGKLSFSVALGPQFKSYNIFAMTTA